MAKLSDLLARQNAAGGMMRETEAPEPGLAPEEGIPEAPAAPAGGGVEDALAMLETALEGMDPKMAEEIRTHVNAIREIASQDVGPAMAEQEPPAEEGAAPEEPKIQV